MDLYATSLKNNIFAIGLYVSILFKNILKPDKR